jgi:hypothetical protein
MKKFLFTQHYRFGLAQSFLTIINFGLLIITASDKAQRLLGIPEIGRWVLVLILLGYAGIWAFGYVMDRWVDAGRQIQQQQLDRSELFDAIKRIERKLS